MKDQADGSRRRTESAHREAPGSTVPAIRPLPHRSAWFSMAHLLAFPLGAVGGFVIASVLLGSTEMGSLGFIVGLVLASWFSKDIKDMTLSSAAKRQLKPRADANPPDVSSCVQLGLYIAHTDPPGTPGFTTGEDYFRRALGAEPSHRDARIGLALALQRRGAHKEIAEVLADWLSSNPDLVGELLVASALRKGNHHQDAVTHYRKALELSPSLAEVSEVPWAETVEDIEEYVKQHNAS